LEGPAQLTTPTLLTILPLDLGCTALIMMIRVPALPSRLNAISMPSARSDVWARRRQLESARGDFGQSTLRAPRLSPETSATSRRRSDALPVQVVNPDIIRRTWVATASA
jgi:hypothetical protein